MKYSDFWILNASALPNLAKIAHKLNSCFCSNANIEQNFSISKLLTENRKNKTSLKLLQARLICYLNKLKEPINH